MPARPPNLIGAHVSVARGLPHGLAQAAAIGAEVIQIFVANPRGWAPPRCDDAADERFGAACADAGVPVFVHAPYLINLGSPSPATLANSVAALAFSMRRAARVGARGVVVHAGSAVLVDRLDEARRLLPDLVLPVLDAVPGARVLVEPTAGGGAALAADADSLAAYLDALGRDERVGVCLDSCHLHAAGHDLSTPAGFAAALRAYARAAGRGRIRLVHVNDSRDPAGSRRDRHETIGAGTIGREPFAALFSSPATRGVPLVVETADTSHRADIATLAALRAAALAAA